jgi:hypothetical protein
MIAASGTAARPLARAGRQTATSIALAALLVALTACASGNANSGLATSDAVSAAPASAPPATASATAEPAPAAPTAPAVPAQHLTATQINEKCWMRTEAQKAGDIDKRMKLVDKCVEEMKRAQGGV